MSTETEPGPDAPVQEWLAWFDRQAVAATVAAKAAPGKSAPAKQPASHNRVIPAKEFIGELKARPWRVKKLWPLDAQVCLIFGDSQDGKSFFLADVLGCVHRGVPWNGLPVQRGKVVALIGEGSGDYRYRHEVYRLANKLEHADLFPVIDNAPDLLDAKQAAEVTGQIRAAGGCDALLIDTLSSTFSGDEKGSDMNRYLRNVRLMQRALGCCVWIISHRGKDASKGVRGWSGQKATADVELEITRDEDVRTVTVTKAKGFSEGAQFHFKLNFVSLGRDPEGDDYGSCVVEYVEAPRGKKQTRLTSTQKQGRDVLRKFSPAAERVQVDDVVAGILKAKGFKPSDVKGYHKRDARQTLNELRDLGHAWIDDTGELCASSAVVQDNGGWLE